MEKQRCQILPEHLKLIQRFIVGWCGDEFGAPEIDPKRPYGNSNVYQDMVEILGTEKKGDKVWLFKLFGKEYYLSGNDEYNLELPEELKKSLDKLHHETEQVLQVCLTLQKFETGTYEAEAYTENWQLISK